MTYQEYAQLSYEEKLRFPAAEYRRIVEADHADYRKTMRRVELFNRLTRPFPWVVMGLAVAILAGAIAFS